jgi:hypothetical protein
MTDYAVVVLAPEETPEGRGRILHAFTTARDLAASGASVAIYFDGIGVTCLTAFHARDNQFTSHYGPLFDEVRPLIAGACDFCARGRFDATDAVGAFGIEFLGGDGRHHSLAEVLLNGATVVTF